jgi:CheY-like chemotaxis protein
MRCGLTRALLCACLLTLRREACIQLIEVNKGRRAHQARSPMTGELIEFDPGSQHSTPDPDRSVSIMLVDDQPVFREVARALLERDGDFDVIAEAGDGPDAILMVDSVHPDVVIMDIQMSAMSGIEATRRILSEHPNASVVLTSMSAESEYLRLVREIGAVAFIAKRNLNAPSLRSALEVGPSNEPLAA